MTLTRLRNNQYLGATSSASTFQNNTPYDFYVFIDPDDGNKIKCRNGRTGAIEKTDATDASIPLQYAIDQLSTGSTVSTWYWTGGKYGSIFIGAGTFLFFNGVIYHSQMILQGAGLHTTIFKWPDNTLLGTHNQTMFRSSTWDANHISATPSNGGDAFVTFRDLDIDGNWINNNIPDANTATTTLDGSGYETAALDSWGHGIAHYGYGLKVENAAVHGCPGAAIIIQFTNGVGVNTEGSIYPPGTGTRWYTDNNYIRNVECWGNGRQGLLIRAQNVYVDNYWGYHNGEAGIDIQKSSHFPNSLAYISGIEIFLDGKKHGDQSSVTYDPLGFEMRVNGSAFMNNCWIEAPYGPGDNLIIGSPPPTSAPSPTGYQISVGGSIHAQGLQLDNMRWSGIFLTAASFDNIIEARCSGNSKAGTAITPARIEGYGNKLDLIVEGFNFAGCTGILLGQPGVFSSNGNDIRISAGTTNYILNCVHTGNAYNTIDIKIRGYPFPSQLLGIFDPASLAFDYAANTLNVDAPNIAGFRSHNGGVATLTGNGVKINGTDFPIPHLLFDAPLVYDVKPHNAAAVTAGVPYITADATNLYLNFAAAPVTSTMTYVWSARVSP